MKKSIWSISVCMLLALVLVGCQQADEKPVDKQPTEQAADGHEEGEKKAVKVVVSVFEGQPSVTFDDEASLQIFEEVLTSAEKVEGIADMIEPDYAFAVTYENKETEYWHAWIRDKGQTGNLLKTSDTHTVYTVPAELTEKIAALITPRFE